jgi:hypothetical protein
MNNLVLFIPMQHLKIKIIPQIEIDFIINNYERFTRMLPIYVITEKNEYYKVQYPSYIQINIPPPKLVETKNIQLFPINPYLYPLKFKFYNILYDTQLIRSNTLFSLQAQMCRILTPMLPKEMLSIYIPNIIDDNIKILQLVEMLKKAKYQKKLIMYREDFDTFKNIVSNINMCNSHDLAIEVDKNFNNDEDLEPIYKLISKINSKRNRGCNKI